MKKYLAAAIALLVLLSCGYAEGPAPEKGDKYYFTRVRSCVKVPERDGHDAMQGGGTDGTYACQVMINTKTSTVLIYKYDLATWVLSAALETLQHANDITCDTDRLPDGGFVIGCNGSNGVYRVRLREKE